MDDDQQQPKEDPDQPGRARLAELQAEHRSLDLVIARHAESSDIDELTLRRLKKRKLRLKDEIFALECSLTPDILA